MTTVTALARPIDLTVPSNRLVVFASGTVAVVGTLVLWLVDAELGLAAAAGRGVRFGVGTFLAWAIARELDPDRPLSARNAVLAYLPALVLGVPALAAAAALLFAARVTLRSSGAAPTVVDLVVLVVLAGVAATSGSGFVAGLALAWAVFEDGRLPTPAPQPRTQLAAAAVAAAALTVSVVTGSFVTPWRAPGLPEVVWIALVVLAVVVRPRPLDVSSPDDRRGPMSATRLVRARRIVLAALALALLWAGADAVPALAPAAAAFLGIGAASPRWLGRRDLTTPVDPSPGVR